MTANEALREHFKSLTMPERNKLTIQLVSALEISAGTIHNWRYGMSRIKRVYQREITRIIGKDIFAEVID